MPHAHSRHRLTGTPAGVGGVRSPRRLLKPGEELHSWVEGLGALRNPLIAGPAYPASLVSVPEGVEL